jgi:hypothetical protein
MFPRALGMLGLSKLKELRMGALQTRVYVGCGAVRGVDEEVYVFHHTRRTKGDSCSQTFIRVPSISVLLRLPDVVSTLYSSPLLGGRTLAGG